MSTGNSIQGSVGVDLSPLKRDFQEAERVATAAGAKLEQTIKRSSANASRAMRPVNWSNVANGTGLLDPVAERRRRNSAAGFAPARAGQYPAPESEVSKRRGSGSGGGPFGVAGAMTAVYAVQRLVEGWERINDEALELRSKIRDITKLTGSATFRSASDIQSNLKAGIDTLADLRKRDTIENQSSPLARLLIKWPRQLLTGATSDSDAQQREALKRQARQDIASLGTKQSSLNSAQLEGMFGSSAEAERIRLRVTQNERLSEAASTESAAGINGRGDLMRAAEEASRMENEALERRIALKKEESELDYRTAERGASAINPARSNIAGLRDRSQMLRSRFALPTTDEQRLELGSQRMELAGNLFDAQFKEAQSNRGQAGVEMRRQRRKQLRDRSSYAANQTDLLDRKSRGARDQIALGDETKPEQNAADEILALLRRYLEGEE